MVDEAVTRARNAGSRALLVMHRGRLQLERYFGADEADTLLPAGLVARPLAAMALGVALAEGRIGSLDVPVARYLHEWDGEARGPITLRQLLEDTSGLETGGDIARLLDRIAVDRSHAPAALRDRPRRANVVRQRFRIQPRSDSSSITSPADSTTSRRPIRSSSP